MVWNASQWKEQFELLTTQRNSKQKGEATFLLRNMRADVFKHTVFLVQQGHYNAGNGLKIAFPNSDNNQHPILLHTESGLSSPCVERRNHRPG